jgi:hypothetical protein
MKDFFVHLFHIFIVGSLFLYVGSYKTEIPKLLFPVLFILGLIIILYHTYKTYNYYTKQINPWVNLIHVLLIGPLLIYIGYNNTKTSRMYFELLLMFGFAAIGYHGYYLLK